MTPFSLEGQVVVVTGGSGLLGSGFCTAIREAGGTAINADINCESDLEQQQYRLDITDPESVRALLDAIQARFGRLDGWVNNAYPRTKDWGVERFENIPIETWRVNIDSHLNGYFICCQQALEVMKKQGFGSFINMGSIYGVNGPDFWIYEGTHLTNSAGYAAIKGGLINMSRYLAAYYGPYGVRVNCLSPGGIAYPGPGQPASFVERYETKVPLRRMGTPEDISPSIVFLLADASRYITGHNLLVDGGWTAI